MDDMQSVGTHRCEPTESIRQSMPSPNPEAPDPELLSKQTPSASPRGALLREPEVVASPDGHDLNFAEHGAEEPLRQSERLLARLERRQLLDLHGRQNLSSKTFWYLGVRRGDHALLRRALSFLCRGLGSA